MHHMIRIANGAGFLGDQLDAPRRLVETAEVDYLTIEHLAELTMSILARLREKDPEAGYANDYLDIVRSLIPALKAQPQLKIIANSGGMNPPACARAVAKVLAEAGLGELSIGVVTGDDLVPRIDSLLAAGYAFENLDTGEPLAALLHRLGGRQEVVSANAYLGAKPIADALAGGARMIITGRVADASLTLGPAMHEFGWAWDDWPNIAAATTAGHLIECGAQVTGGYTTNWQVYRLADVGYPIAELSEDGGVVITKPAGSGGAVNCITVREQLIYEISDPAQYLTPDIALDLTTVDVKELSPDRVAVRNCSGRPPTDTYKVSLAYRDGYMATGQLLVYGADCVAKANACGQIILDRLAAAGFTLARTHLELLGTDMTRPAGKSPIPNPQSQILLRLSAHDPRRDAVERFTKEFAPLITSGPAGLAGYAAGRPQVRPVFAYWPTLVPKSSLKSTVEVRPAKEWA
jgi:hypothetical protein